MRIVVVVAGVLSTQGGRAESAKPNLSRILSHLVNSSTHYRVGQPSKFGSLASRGLADAGAHDVAHDHLIDLLRSKAGAFDGALDRGCTELCGRERTQRTVELSEGARRVWRVTYEGVE